ncbi:MAG: AI-2E family transporter [Calditrichia bacterium]
MTRPVRISFGVLFFVLAIAFLYFIGPLVKILIISALIAYILDPLAGRLESRGMSRTMATLIVFSGLMAILIGFILLLLPVITQEVKELQAAFAAGEVQIFFKKTESLLQERLAGLGISNLNLTERLQTFFTRFGEGLLGYLLNVVSIITNLVIIPFIIFFLLKDGQQIKKQLISLVPNRYFEFSLNLLYKMDLQLGNYLRGQFLDAFIIGILSITALWILGINYFFVIGAFAGLANLIPYIGPITGAIPAIIVSVVQTGNFSMVTWIVLAFAIVQLADNVLVQPIVVAKTVNMHPLLVLLVVIIGGQFMGILGMILAVPVTGVLKVIIQETYRSYKQYSF